MQKIAFIIAKRYFRDEEFFVPARMLENAGYEVVVVSNAKKGESAVGANGGEVVVDLELENLNPENFDMVVFVGGPGALENLDNEISYKIAQKTVELKKKLAAICIAPTILAKAGVLKGKKATCWSSEENKKPIKVLEENGAEYTGEDVVRDGDLVTANGPAAAEKFGKILLEILKE
ncbi:MAG: DJ-1 family protein [Candidatus Parcubacteria bacterium]|nr:MAG: DJ-1 family protein [Candidatus Parcubacteria bacterium]